MQFTFPRTLLGLLAGPIIWAIHFLSIYAVNGIACARLQPARLWAGLPLSSWIIVTLSVVALGAIAACLPCQRNLPPVAEHRFLPTVAALLSLLSAVAVVWETVPVLLMAGCQ